MTASRPAADVAAVRRFNRFYTRHLGVLDERWLGSAFSLAEARVLYELSINSPTTASDLIDALGLDAGYLSRILRRLHKRGLVSRKTSPRDARRHLLALAARGKKAFAPLERRSNADIARALGRLAPAGRARLARAMDDIETILDPAAGRTGSGEAGIVLRAPRHGDFGWIVTAHARLYAREYGWGLPFEGLCAQIVADYVNHHDPRFERCWIAEMSGENVGSVMLVKDKPGEKSPAVARLRLLLVDPAARGLGLGARLTEECIGFARATGYRQVTLWTHSVLTAARHIYEQAGFTLTASEKRRSWGQDVVAEFWDLALQTRPGEPG